MVFVSYSMWAVDEECCKQEKPTTSFLSVCIILDVFSLWKKETLLCKKRKRKRNKNVTQANETGCHQGWWLDATWLCAVTNRAFWSWVICSSIKLSQMCQLSGKGKGQGRTRKLHLYFKTSFHEAEVLWHFKGGCLELKR